MAAAAGSGRAAAEPRDMQTFVRRLFQSSPDLSTLTHAIVRKKYLLHIGQECLTKKEKEQLKQLVEEELVQMQTEDSPSGGVKSENHKRSRYSSDTSDEEPRSKQQKKQRTEQELEVSSDDEDSGIDSKKVRLRGNLKGDGGEKIDDVELEDSEPDGQGRNNKRKKAPWKSSREKREQSKAKQKQRNSLGDESEESLELSDLEKKMGKCRKGTKGLATDSESSSEQEQRRYKPQKRQKVDSEQSGSDSESEGKDRKKAEQRGKKTSESDEGSGPSQVRRTGKTDGSRDKNEKMRIRSKKMQNKRWSLWKTKEESESEQELRSSSVDGKSRVWGKTGNSHHKRENRTKEELCSSTDEESHEEEEAQRITSPTVKEKRNYTSTSSSEEELEICFGKEKKRILSRNNLGDEQKKMQTALKQKKSRSSEESDSEMEQSKPRRKRTEELSGSECGSESEAEEAGKGERKSKKMPTSSNKSEHFSEACEGGSLNKRAIVKKQSKTISGSDSSEDGEKLKKGGAEKPQTTAGNMESSSDSGDSGSESQRSMEVQAPRRKQKNKGKSGNKTEEENSSLEDEENPSASAQHRQGKEKEHHSGKSEEHPSIRRLKRYIRECGVYRNYKKLLGGCRSRKAQVAILKQELENPGLEGTPSLAKCKALKQKREEAAEVASLDISNIIATEGRPRRRNVWSLYSKSEEAPSSPEEPTVRRRPTDWSCLKGVISSDGESN